MEQVTPPGHIGRVIRRVRPDAHCDIFLGLAKPSNHRMVVLPLAEASLSSLDDLPTSRGVEARIARPGDDGAEVSLELVLMDPRAADIFTALAADVAGAAAVEPNEARAVSAFVGRLRRWQRFLKESGPGGLEPEQQRGLFGELWLMRHLLLDVFGPAVSVAAWTGPSHAAHDYQLGRGAIEVKTSVTKQDQHLSIASERQLDATGLGVLFVFHLSLDEHRNAGSSLVELIEDLRAHLASTPEAPLFEDRLFDAGYMDAQSPLYANPGYTVRESNFFRVTRDFPRIVEADLRPGVADVRYAISVAECKHHVEAPDVALGELADHHDG
jgi:hypothetical protein